MVTLQELWNNAFNMYNSFLLGIKNANLYHLSTSVIIYVICFPLQYWYVNAKNMVVLIIWLNLKKQTVLAVSAQGIIYR